MRFVLSVLTIAFGLSCLMFAWFLSHHGMQGVNFAIVFGVIVTGLGALIYSAP